MRTVSTSAAPPSHRPAALRIFRDSASIRAIISRHPSRPAANTASRSSSCSSDLWERAIVTTFEKVEQHHQQLTWLRGQLSASKLLRYDKLAITYRAAVTISAILTSLRHMGETR